MKKGLKAVALVLAVPLAWAAIFAFYLLGWGNITVNQMVAKYNRVGWPQGGVVLMGSSSMQVWTDSAADLGPLRSVNVGVGGSVTDNWLDWAGRLVVPFAPEAVVVYVGANDLHNSLDAPADVLPKLERLFGQLHEALPGAKLYYVSVYTTGAHTHLRGADEELNRLVRQLAEQTDYLSYIDCATPLMDAAGNVREDVFLDDLVHLNETGYALWARAIRTALLADFPLQEGGAA